MNGRQSPVGGILDWFRGQYRRRPKPVWMVVAMDIALIGIALLVFSLFHHVLPHSQVSVGLVSSRENSGENRDAIASVSDNTDEIGDDEASDFSLGSLSGDDVSFPDDGQAGATTADEGGVEGDGTEEPDGTEYPDGADASAAAVEEASGEKVGNLLSGTPGDFGVKFADKFTDGKVIKTDNGYQSANVNITLGRYDTGKVVFYVADIYIRDISCFVTAFAQGRYGKGIRNWVGSTSQEIGGVLAINGDYYGGRDDGIVIRNGELYRSDKYPDRDVCVLFWDGTMETYGTSAFDAQAAINAGAYQAWNFGPRLLDENGRAKTRFNSSLAHSNPRTVLGYYEPGHYAFVVVDGRSKTSQGITLKDLAALMEQLGCMRAYNMDGGNTSVMIAGSTTVNNPSGGGRPCTDIIAIVDKQT